MLPHVTFVGVIRSNPRRFKYQLVETEVAIICGAGYTGSHMDEIVPPLLREQVQRAYDFGCDTADIVLFYGAYVRASSSYYTVTRIALPVIGPNGEIDASCRPSRGKAKGNAVAERERPSIAI